MKNLKTFDKLFESAVDFINLPPSAGLVVYADDAYIKNLHLFDFKENKCLGTISMYKMHNRGTSTKLWGVMTVAAEKGFGPLMYRGAMMNVHPEELCPYRGTIRPDAINIWRMYNTNPEELVQRRIGEDDSLYHDYGGDDELNWILNTAYSRPPSFWFKKRLSMGERFMEQYKIDAKTIDTVCKKYFTERYENR